VDSIPKRIFEFLEILKITPARDPKQV